MPDRRPLFILANVMAGILSLGCLNIARADNFEPWTTVGSAGTVDEADLSEVLFTGGIASLRTTLPAQASLTIRYNVVAVDGLLQGGDAVNMKVRFRDNGANARVSVALRQYNFNTGLTTTRITFDSNSFAASNSYQVQSVNSRCFSGNFFDFFNNAYFVEVTLIKTGSGGDPSLALVGIGSTLC